MAAKVGEICCGCSGTRSCLLCEQIITSKNDSQQQDSISRYHFCLVCSNVVKSGEKCTHLGENFGSEKLTTDKVFDGLEVFQDFINETEENEIVNEIDKTVWKPSQSGRRKQDYGPQVNFKRKKVKLTHFNGLPSFSKFLVERMITTIPSLKDFKTVELCNLEYIPDRGSSIDPHFDDFWLWGERLVTLNLLSNTIITMSNDDINSEIDVELPRRSLIVMSGTARYKWKHAIKRENITSRRLAITLRELSSEFLDNGPNEELGQHIHKIAMTFSGSSVQANLKKQDAIE